MKTTSDNIERNARALKTLGVMGVVVSLVLAIGVILTVLGSDDAIAALREESLRLLFLLLVAGSTVRNFQIAGSLRKQAMKPRDESTAQN